jgi:hypothetical protein
LATIKHFPVHQTKKRFQQSSVTEPAAPFHLSDKTSDRLCGLVVSSWL